MGKPSAAKTTRRFSSMDLTQLNPEQTRAVLHKEGPLLVLAAAGTGKTRVITYRVARLIEEGVPPDRILAVTFTNKAAEEMRNRVEALAPGRGGAVWIHTFHGLCAKMLRRHGQAVGLGPHFTIYDQSDQKKLIADVMRELGLEREASKAAMYAGIISRAKDDLLDAGSYAIYAETATDHSRRIAAKIYSIYQKRLDAAGAADFGDLLLKTCSLFKENEPLRSYYQEWFLHVLVDEYQDTNHAQYALVKTLTARRRNLCVVGDDDQSVYSWRGADIRNILEFERDFKDAAVVTLERNYRSTKPILGAAARVIGRNKRRKPKTLWTQKEGGAEVCVRELQDEREEAAWVARAIAKENRAGRPLSNFAIFYRTNAQSRAFEEALRRENIPHRLVGAMRFYERQEIKDILAYARVLVNPRDSLGLLRIANVPPRGVGKTSLDRVKAWAHLKDLSLWDAFESAEAVEGLGSGCRKSIADFVAFFKSAASRLQNLSAREAVALILERSRYLDWLDEESESDPEAATRASNVQELLNSAQDYEDRRKKQGVPANLSDYLAEISLQTDVGESGSSAEAVTLMTLHLAKGLEYPTVFLTGLEEGLFPIGAGNISPEELEEERRLCYVGMTRAKENLLITHAATRRVFGTTYSNIPSRFILEAQVNDPAPPPKPSRPWPTAPTRAGAGLRIGSRVRHPMFGVGEVLEKSGAGEHAKALVRFENGRLTKLALRYAPLELLSEAAG